MASSTDLDALRARAGDHCELCGRDGDLKAAPVPPGDGPQRAILACGDCAQAVGLDEPLAEQRWFCLKDAVWSAVPAVQVASVRLLRRVAAPWAQDLVAQVYLDDETQAWVDASQRTPPEDSAGDAPTLDSNGTRLADGDSVTLVQDLDVKGGGFTAKRGTLVKGIKLTGDPDHVEGKINKSVIVLKTRFLKKA